MDSFVQLTILLLPQLVGYHHHLGPEVTCQLHGFHRGYLMP